MHWIIDQLVGIFRSFVLVVVIISTWPIYLTAKIIQRVFEITTTSLYNIIHQFTGVFINNAKE